MPDPNKSPTTLLPSLNGLGYALTGGLFTPLSAAIVIFYATRVLKRPSVVVALLTLGACGAGAIDHNRQVM